MVVVDDHPALTKRFSVPKPILVFGEHDNQILNHIHDLLFDYIDAVIQTQTQTNKIHFNGSVYDIRLEFTILRSDGGPRGKYTGLYCLLLYILYVYRMYHHIC